MAILIRELGEIYAARRAGRPVPPGQAPSAFDAAARTYLAAAEVAAQRRATKAMSGLLLRDTPVITDYFINYVTASSSKVKNYVPEGLSHIRLAKVSLRPPPATAWRLVFATGAAETIGFVAVALARRFAPMTLVAPVASLSSALTVLYAWLVLRERPSALAAVGALLACVGVAVLAA